MTLLQTLGGDDEVRTALSNRLQSAFDCLLPAHGLDVVRFLLDAAFAIDGKEADLARILGINRSTISTWKKRGIIPAKHLRWFQTSLIPAAFANPRRSGHPQWSGPGGQTALAIFDQTDFNPYGRQFADRSAKVQAAYDDMPAIANIGSLVHSRAMCGRYRDGRHHDIYGYVAPLTLELSTIAKRLIELGAPVPPRDKYGFLIFPDA